MEIVRFADEPTSDLGPLFCQYEFGRYCHDRSLEIGQSRRIARSPS
jgi:hypothetical protein